MSQKEKFTELDGRTVEFDNLLPVLPAQLGAESKRITITRESTTDAITLARPNWFHEAIFIALATAFQTPWFTSLTRKSQNLHLFHTRKLFNWINELEYHTTKHNCYECLKDFEAHRINVDGVKYSPLRYIRAAMQKGLHTEKLSDDKFHYLRTLLRLTTLPLKPKAKPFTLTDWFDFPWMRAILGEKKYLSLESPSRLCSSFRVTVAITLSHLLELRDQWEDQPNQHRKSSRTRDWHFGWNSQLIKQMGVFNEVGEPANNFTELMYLDMVADRERSNLKTLIAENGKEALRKQPLFPKRFAPWRLPVFFHPDNLCSYSTVEETLMAWLVACETVQPTDIPKLKTTDYACQYNSSGRLIAMQCCYYKGRAGAIREPAMLAASDCWTKVQHKYLRGLPTSARLFQHNVLRPSNIPKPKGDRGSANSPLKFIFKLWQTPFLQAHIRASCKRSGTLPVFLEAALALIQECQSPNYLRAKAHDSLRLDHETETHQSLPFLIFSLTHIKTTAVHAGSDKYRDGDLINHHSHTSATERHHYLNDANKDFVNRAGRVTRLVLHDLQNVVYQPSVSVISQAVNDLELRSRVVEATGSSDAQVHPLYLSTSSSLNTEDLVLVPDSAEQALIFIHFITQAEKKYHQLLSLRPDWLERTLIPHLEWMSRTLARMASSTAAKKQYTEIESYLPPVFDHLLETHE